MTDALKAQRFSRDPYAIGAGANEIVRLKAVNAELVAVLERIVNSGRPMGGHLRAEAITALKTAKAQS